MSSRSILLAVLCITALGCSNSVEDDAIQVDTELVGALTEWHLANAREALVDSSIDSLKSEVLESLGYDSTELANKLASLASQPDQTSAVYEAVAERLREERRDP